MSITLKFKEIIDCFLLRITDYDFREQKPTTTNLYLSRCLKSACAEVNRLMQEAFLKCDATAGAVSLEPVDEDDDGAEMREIIVLGMLCQWISPKLMNTDNFENYLNTKDINAFSPANLLNQMRGLKSDLDSQFKAAVVNYSYRRGKLGGRP